MSFFVFSCEACGHAVFPARYLCPVCHGRQWRKTPVHEGVVQETTATRYKMGGSGQDVLHLATVATSGGPIVIARLDGAVDEGATVSLALEDGALLAGRTL